VTAELLTADDLANSPEFVSLHCRCVEVWIRNRRAAGGGV